MKDYHTFPSSESEIEQDNAKGDLLYDLQKNDVLPWTYKETSKTGRWNGWLARHDNLPLGCLAPHLNRILRKI